MLLSSSCNTNETSLCTIGETIITVGKEIIKAKLQARNQITSILFTKPTLKTLMTKDIMPDISNAMKKENTIL